MKTATEIFRTFCEYHLGDQLVHLNFLHRCAREMPGAVFEHAAPAQYLPELEQAIEGIDAIRLVSLSDARTSWTNAWRGSRGWWYAHPGRADFARVHLDWFAELGRRMGLPIESPIQKRTDLLFEFPALAEDESEKVVANLKAFERLCSERNIKAGRIGEPAPSPGWQTLSGRSHSGFIASVSWHGRRPPTRDEIAAHVSVPVEGETHPACRILVIDSPPGSGQFAGYHAGEMVRLYDDLGGAAAGVLRTAGPQKRSLVEWGRLAASADLIVGVATGPMWLTYHELARGARRLWLLDHERVSIFGTEAHAGSIQAARDLLKAEGWF